MAKADPNGYYQVLNVSPGASSAEIRLAYEFLKRSYREGRKHLQISKIRAAYETLADPKKRRAYDDGATGDRSSQAGGQRRNPLESISVVQIGAILLLAGSIVLFFLVGPDLRARFVSFDTGEQLVWSDSGAELGSIVAFDEHHEFPTGVVAPAYSIRPETGGDPVWYPARDLERHCRAR